MYAKCLKPYRIIYFFSPLFTFIVAVVGQATSFIYYWIAIVLLLNFIEQITNKIHNIAACAPSQRYSRSYCVRVSSAFSPSFEFSAHGLLSQHRIKLENVKCLCVTKQNETKKNFTLKMKLNWPNRTSSSQKFDCTLFQGPFIWSYDKKPNRMALELNKTNTK